MKESFLSAIEDQINHHNKKNDLFQLIAKRIQLIAKTISRYEASIYAYQMQGEEKRIKEVQEKLDIPDEDFLSWLERSRADADKNFEERYISARDRLKKNYLRRYPNTEKQDIENLKLFLAEKYYLPDEPKDILSHLKTIFLYYVEIMPMANIIPQSMTTKIDNAALLLMQAGASDPIVIEKFGKKYDRLRESKRGLKKKTSKRKQLVIEAYNQIKNKNRTPHALAGIISRNLHQKGLTPPSLNTIKKYLKEEGKI